MTKIFVFPGQGSQKIGMGKGLFEMYPELTEQVDHLLGHSIKQLCLEDPNGLLNKTHYTQPALFTVNALTYLKQMETSSQKPDFVAGHSLGEYNALFAAEAFDFTTGFRLVKKRGEIMAKVRGGGMAAVVGIDPERIQEILTKSGCDSIDIANFNSPKQTVISGLKTDIEKVSDYFENAGAMFIPLKVSGAFHSRYMKDPQDEFDEFVNNFNFKRPKIPVISNYEALPYHDNIAENLVQQISNPVRWTECVQYLLRQDQPEFEEIGPGRVLTGLINQIRRSEGKKSAR